MEEIKAGYMRVSEVLGRLRDRSAIDPDVLHIKACIGTEVHSNIHHEVNGIPPHFGYYPVCIPTTGEVVRSEQRGKGYFESWQKWNEKQKPVYKIMEERYYCDDLMLTGQIDALIHLQGQKTPYLLDFKCSYSADKEIWNMQAHFYWYLLKQKGIDISHEIIFLQLKKDGKKPTEHVFEFDENVLSRCIQEAQMTWEEKNLAKMLD